MLPVYFLKRQHGTLQRKFQQDCFNHFSTQQRRTFRKVSKTFRKYNFYFGATGTFETMTRKMRQSLNLNFPALYNFHRPQQGLTTKPTLRGTIGRPKFYFEQPLFRQNGRFYFIFSSPIKLLSGE